MTQTETLELLVATLQQANSSQSESIERLTRQNEQLQNKLQELLAQVGTRNTGRSRSPRTCLLDDSQKESASEPQHVGWPSCSGDCHRTRRSRSG